MNIVVLSIKNFQKFMDTVNGRGLEPTKDFEILFCSSDIQQSKTPAPPKRNYEIEVYEDDESIHDKMSYDIRSRALEEAMRYERSGFGVRIFCNTQQYDTSGNSLKPSKTIIYQSDGLG